MAQTYEAIFENGALKFMTPLQGVSDGQRVRITVSPVTELADFKGLSEEALEERFLQWMEQHGKLDTSAWPAVEGPKDFQPIKISGPPVSETIIEDRR